MGGPIKGKCACRIIMDRMIASKKSIISVIRRRRKGHLLLRAMLYQRSSRSTHRISNGLNKDGPSFTREVGRGGEGARVDDNLSTVFIVEESKACPTMSNLVRVEPSLRTSCLVTANNGDRLAVAIVVSEDGFRGDRCVYPCASAAHSIITQTGILAMSMNFYSVIVVVEGWDAVGASVGGS